jgi:hypothetical protein
MRSLACAVMCLAAVTTASVVTAQSPFDGTWKFNADGVKMSEKVVLTLKDGVYACASCDVKTGVAADGKDHPDTGSLAFDSRSVTIVNDSVIDIVTKKGGKLHESERVTAAADGKTMTFEAKSVAANGQEGVTKAQAVRVAPGPAGAHKISGTWEVSKLISASDNASLVTLKSIPNGLSMSDPMGNAWEAKFDGKDYPSKGDPGVTHVSLRKIDDRTFEQTDKRNGTIVGITRMTVSADGKTLQGEGKDPIHNSSWSATAVKQ